LAAYATGAAVVTEHCYSMSNSFPPETYISHKYSELPIKIKELLENISSLEDIAHQGYNWLANQHSRNCEDAWNDLLKNIEK
jgi:hypothetical protein